MPKLIDRITQFAKGSKARDQRIRLTDASQQKEHWLEKQVQEYNALTAVITDRLGAAVPPFDPYMLLAFLDANGYLTRGNRWKVAGTVGPGFDCSDRLREHLKYANNRQTFRAVLRRWAFDIENFGYSFVEVRRGTNTAAFHHMAALKTRVKPFEDGSQTYIHYEYGLGLLFYQEYDEFQRGSYSGVSMFNLPSARGHLYYGDPEWAPARGALESNVNILNVGLKYFENSLISDMAITLKGAELDPDEREKIRAYLSATMKGADNAHKVLFFEVGPNESVDFRELNMKMDDGILNVRKENKEEIVVTNGVPQRLIGILQAGQLGGVGEVAGQMKIFKLGFADDRQQDYNEYWQRLLDDAGLPDAETFELLPMKIDGADLPGLTQAAGQPILSVEEAHDEWELNKSESFIDGIRKIRTALEEETAFQKSSGLRIKNR